MILGNRQRGDTIIEVLFAMTIIGITLGGAFGIANRSLAIGRAAQERTEALKIAETQIELIKIAHDNDTPSIRTQAANFCMGINGAGALVKRTIPDAGCNNQNVYGNGTGLYSVIVSVEKGLPPDVTQFNVVVTWERINSRDPTPGRLQLVYRPEIY